MYSIPMRGGSGPSTRSEGAGPPVLLIPGLLSTAAIWAGVVPQLAQHGRVIAYDLQGHLPPGRRSIADHAACWRSLMDYLELPSAHLVAHGSGCGIATLLALETPCRTRSLTVVNPVIARTETASGLQHTWHLNMLTQWLETGHGSILRKPENQHALEQVLSQQTLARLPEPAAAGCRLPAAVAPDLAGLSQLDLPVMAVSGQCEPAEHRQLAQTIYARAPHFRYREIEGVRYSCPREMPAQLAQVVAAFLHDAENPISLR